MNTLIGSSGSESLPRHSAPAITLAQFVAALIPSSLCFCCGATLMPSFGGGGVSDASCPACNAAVEMKEACAFAHAA